MSQQEVHKKEIGGKKYEMYGLPPMTSHDLLMDVIKMAAPTLGPIVDAFFSKMKGEAKSVEEIMEMDIGADLFTNATNALSTGLDKRVFKDVMNAFKEVTTVDGVTLDKVFDDHFRGRLEDLYMWLAWGMSVQWGKSLTALVGGIGNLGGNKNQE